MSSIMGWQAEVDVVEHTVRHRWHLINGFLRKDLIVWTRHWLKPPPGHNLEKEIEI